MGGSITFFVQTPETTRAEDLGSVMFKNVTQPVQYYGTGYTLSTVVVFGVRRHILLTIRANRRRMLVFYEQFNGCR